MIQRMSEAQSPRERESVSIYRLGLCGGPEPKEHGSFNSVHDISSLMGFDGGRAIGKETVGMDNVVSIE